MNREIKFRAWEAAQYPNGLMHTPKQLIGLEGEMSKNCPTGLELMQYTGLKDKNGKEIYQDDILRVCKSFYGDYLVRVVWDETQCCFATDNYSAKQIKNPKRWDLKHDCVRSHGFCMNSYSQLIGGYNNTSHSYKDGDQTKTGYDFEVVGNYHQNKDLLT